MKLRWLTYLCLIMAGPTLWAQGNGRIVQGFNQSVNQIGDCWQNYNMAITTKNTINRANQKKALVGQSPLGQPAYHFTSPLLSFNGSGNIAFRHKLTAANGQNRRLELQLLDAAERPVQTLFTYQYRFQGSNPNGNPTQTVNTQVPVTWTGTYILRWSFSGSGGGNSVAMVDDITISATDVSDPRNDNGYGYCRPDDVVYDTVCADSRSLHKVPYPIAGSNWQWQLKPTSSLATLDTTVVGGPQDTTAAVNWQTGAAGDYELNATEIRPPYQTTTYNVLFYLHVLPAPRTGPIWHR